MAMKASGSFQANEHAPKAVRPIVSTFSDPTTRTVKPNFVKVVSLVERIALGSVPGASQ